MAAGPPHRTGISVGVGVAVGVKVGVTVAVDVIVAEAVGVDVGTEKGLNTPQLTRIGTSRIQESSFANRLEEVGMGCFIEGMGAVRGAVDKNNRPFQIHTMNSSA